MFVRAKAVKNKQYAYLVENSWVKGRVRQKVKKYLGKILVLDDARDVDGLLEIDSSLSKKEYISQIICLEFFKRGFLLENNVLINDSINIFLLTGDITFQGKKVVLFMNGRYLYKDILESLLDFFQPEAKDDVKGKKLASAFSDAGISIAPEHFIALYKKIYF